MRILIVSDTFVPDKTAGSNLLKDLINNLKKKNQVTLICARDRYIKNFKKKNFNLININCGYIKHHKFLLRGFFEFLMPFILWIRTKKILNIINPEIIICYSPSIFFYDFCKKIIFKFNCYSYLILRDIFPFWAFDAKIINNLFLKKYLTKYFVKFLALFNKIGVEAKFNVSFVKKFSQQEVVYLPNWITANKTYAKNKFIDNQFIFSGNLGQGQDEIKIFNFFLKLKKYYHKTNQNFKLTLLGDGSNKKKFIFMSKHKEIVLVKKMQYKKFLYFLKNQNFGIISLKDQIQTVNFPGKLLTYLMTRTIVILLTNKRNELSRFIYKNKIGIAISDKTNVTEIMNKLKKLELYLKKNQNHFAQVLKNNFSTNDACNSILKKNK